MHCAAQSRPSARERCVGMHTTLQPASQPAAARGRESRAGRFWVGALRCASFAGGSGARRRVPRPGPEHPKRRVRALAAIGSIVTAIAGLRSTSGPHRASQQPKDPSRAAAAFLQGSGAAHPGGGDMI